MSLQKQLLSNKRLWVRVVTIVAIVGFALLKPKYDQYLADRQAGDSAVAQSDTNPGKTASSKTSSQVSVATASSDADLSLDELLVSIQNDSGGATAGSQTSSGTQKSNPKTTSEKSSTDRSSTKDTTKSAAGNSQTNPGGANASHSTTTKTKSKSKSKTPDAKPRLGKLTLVKGTRYDFRSTAGLVYLPGSADGHRLKHVLKHAKDNPSKPVHGVFDGDRDQILEWIDKAYVMGKKGDKNARKESQRDRVVYTANLNQRVGYVGGQKGKRNNNKECRYLRLVVENGNEVITAYPADRM